MLFPPSGLPTRVGAWPTGAITAAGRVPGLGCPLPLQSRFQRKRLGGRHDFLFKVVFATNAASALRLRVSRMGVSHWRHDRAPLPSWIAEILTDLVQKWVDQPTRRRMTCDVKRTCPKNMNRPLTVLVLGSPAAERLVNTRSKILYGDRPRFDPRRFPWPNSQPTTPS